MKKAEVKIQFVTPCIMSGADQRKAEFRAPSIRGNLRWWMRALGSSNEEVNAIFGSANGTNGMRSRIIVRDTTTGIVSTRSQNAVDLTGSKEPDYFLWPLRPTEKKDKITGKVTKDEHKRGVIPENTTVSFSITVRHANDEQDNAFFKRAMANFERALKAFLLFGSLGTRSRRCYGSIWPTEVIIDGVKWAVPNTKADFKSAVQSLQLPSDVIVPTVVTRKGDNRYSVYPDYNSVIFECKEFLANYRRGSKKNAKKDQVPSLYGKNDHDARWWNNECTCVYRAVLGLPLSQRYSSDGQTVKSSINGYDRLASPLHFKLIKLDNGFVPLAIFFMKMFPQDGTMVNLKGAEVRALPLNTAMINKMAGDPQLIKVERL